ncbi:HNH endonuclease [uncultured Chryseobacterium sp.]|uniref:HNH endonuclease n=1 Tax=uncultured Chryseobacterium sp. TaxID=259322 RepID=UPI0025DB40D8|nr:HNH endonuclease [uncultured Chryseobacterium sp.]
MACNRGKASPNNHVKLQLFADSGGYCQNPNCNKNLFITVGESDFHIAEMAHIFSANDGGPRSNSELTQEERGKFENLILLCPNCHTSIDKADTEYHDSLIKTWKKEHSGRIKEIFSIKHCNTREEVRNLINPLMQENKFIFETYGPNTDERFNPESEVPKEWKHNIHKTILPNNRKILNIINTNYNLLTESEKIVLAKFKTHVKDFEAKHINKEGINGTMFPIEMNKIFL